MNMKIRISAITTALTLAALLSAGFAGGAYAQAAKADKGKAAPKKMSFFVTSTGPGNGGDLGGLAGADKHCQLLADVVGEGNRTWRAYLSNTATATTKAVDARDRIGSGPWYNAAGVMVARNVDDLHDNANIDKKSALTERGQVVNGRGDRPNMHDILTGSDSHGRAFPAGIDTTCGNWTKSTAEGSAQVGHHDRQGLDEKAPAKSWVHSHPSAGCTQVALVRTGGNGLLYCFAAK